MENYHNVARNYPAILFLSGASGVGKTTILDILKVRNTKPSYVFLHYDSIGIPSFTEMIEQDGSLERWQELTTHKWIEKITNEYQDTDTVIIEGQSNLEFVERACQRFSVKRYAIILIDCNWETICNRLTINRQQPELVNADMQNWVKFLREQAQLKGIPIFDTTHQTPEQAAYIIESKILSQLDKGRQCL